jgi:23S rRNA (cytosine1962-C5)-methyltransferase
MAEAVLRLKRGHDRPRAHPWIFKGDVADVTDVGPGSAVTVVDAASRFLGRGFFNPHPALCCRIVTRRDEPLDRDFFLRRLAAAIEHRVRIRAGRSGPDAVAWRQTPAREPEPRRHGETEPAAARADPPSASAGGAASTPADCPLVARLVWSEADGLPGLVVDRYGPALVVQCLTLGMAAVRAMIVDALRALLGSLPVFAADDAGAAALEGFAPSRGWIDEPGPESLLVEEGPVKLRVALEAGHKTGLYLDQADNRRLVGSFAAGRAMLDAFAYTAAFACHALVAGASRALCIESSPDALAGARANLALNGVDGRADVRAANVFDELRALERARARFGLVVLDPPPFARSRTAVDAALRGYKEINLRAMRLLAPGGVLATFSCSHHVSGALFTGVCRDASVDAGVSLRVLASLGQAPDHPVLLAVPETRYLKGLLLEVA